MQEFLLIFSCVYSIGCKETSAAYEQYNPDTVINIRDYLNSYPDWAKTYAPFAVCGLNQVCSVKISDKISLNTKKDQIFIVFQTNIR